MAGLIRAVLNIFFSLLLGVLAFALCVLYQPDFVQMLQEQAGDFKVVILDMLRDMGFETQVRVLTSFVLQDEQFVLMFFVIVTRVVIFFALAFLTWLLGGAFQVEEEVRELEEIRTERAQLEEMRAQMVSERERLDADQKAFEGARRASATSAKAQLNPAAATTGSSGPQADADGERDPFHNPAGGKLV